MLRAYTWMQVTKGDLRQRFSDRLHDEDGGVAAEYGILLALIAVVIIVAAIALGAAVNTKLQQATDGLNGGGE